MCLSLHINSPNVHNVYHFLSNIILAVILWLCNVLFLAVTRKLHIKYLVKSSLPAMFCIREGIDGGKRKQRHLLKSASNGLVGASEFNGFRSLDDKPVSHHALYTVFHMYVCTIVFMPRSLNFIIFNLNISLFFVFIANVRIYDCEMNYIIKKMRIRLDFIKKPLMNHIFTLPRYD